MPVSIHLVGLRYGVKRYDFDDDGEIEEAENLGMYDTAALAAACVIGVLRREAGSKR